MISKLKHLDLAGWIYGLISAVVGGGASSASAAIGASVIDPAKFNLADPMALINLMGIAFGVNAVLSMFLYLKQSPLPKVVQEETEEKGS